jgi:hypothetical protein
VISSCSAHLAFLPFAQMTKKAVVSYHVIPVGDGPADRIRGWMRDRRTLGDLVDGVASHLPGDPHNFFSAMIAPLLPLPLVAGAVSAASTGAASTGAAATGAAATSAAASSAAVSVSSALPPEVGVPAKAQATSPADTALGASSSAASASASSVGSPPQKMFSPEPVSSTVSGTLASLATVTAPAASPLPSAASEVDSRSSAPKGDSSELPPDDDAMPVESG